ncbi:MAG: HutD family protein [Pseudomonadota bacterium]|nr:HutD family protein [Pseudomonadota bacterium]
MRILRAEAYRRMRWKNGGGETAEIAVSPESAGLDDFDWRVSMARIEAGGPFSLFPDVDRTMSVLEGEGMLLSAEGRSPFGLTFRSDPLTFPADAATSAALIAGPATALNVMSRRGRCRHEVSAMDIDGSMEISFDAAQAMLFCRAGSMLLGNEAGQGRLGRFDAVVLDDRRAAHRVEGRGAFFLIEFSLP